MDARINMSFRRKHGLCFVASGVLFAVAGFFFRDTEASLAVVATGMLLIVFGFTLPNYH